MRSLFKGAWVFGLCALTLGATHAQQPPTVEPASPAPWMRAEAFDDIATLQEFDGALLGAGRNYKTRFTPEGIEFTPMIGQAAPHNLPVRLALQSVGRETGKRVTANELGIAERTIDSTRVEYARGWLTERYDVRADALEQSFVFEELPEGDGDLVVRLRIDTELVPRGDGETLDLRFGDLGSVRLSKVVGIDARGVEVNGRMTCANGYVELSLPAGFVDAAALPLVLDPLIGSVFTVASSSADEQYADAAYDRSTDHYMVVWQRRYSSANSDIMAKRYTGSGSLVGSAVFVESSASVIATTPAVCDVNHRDAFVIVWVKDGDDVYGRTLPADLGGITGPITPLVTGANKCVQPELGGESELGSARCILVWTEYLPSFAESYVKARYLVFNSNGTLSYSSVRNLSDTYKNDFDVDISSSGGPERRWFISFARATAGNPIRLMGYLVSWNVTILDSTYVYINGTLDGRNPSVAGDGTHWIVAYEKEESTSTTWWDVECMAFHTTDTDDLLPTISPVSPSITATPGENEADPRVAWLGDAALLVWCDNSTYPDYDIFAVTVDPHSCTYCEGLATIESGARNSVLPALASRYHGGEYSDGSSYLRDSALILWNSIDNSTGDVSIYGVRWNARDGYAYDLGGGCGQGGVATATCSRSPNTNFTMRLFGAEPSRYTWMIISPTRRYLGCGSCQIIADPYFGVLIGSGTTNVVGDRAYTIPIPSSPSLDYVGFYVQWLVDASSPACTLMNLDTSNALDVTIQY